MKQNRMSVLTTVLAAAVILSAVTARLLGVLDILLKPMGIIRSLLYIGLFIGWGLSVRQRIISSGARRYLTAASAFMILWFVVRSLEYYFVTL